MCTGSVYIFQISSRGASRTRSMMKKGSPAGAVTV
jgi:hypothetical protein